MLSAPVRLTALLLVLVIAATGAIAAPRRVIAPMKACRSNSCTRKATS